MPSPGPRGTVLATAPAFVFDVQRWTVSDRVTGLATLALLASLFMPWFGASAAGLFSVSVNGLWHSYMVLGLILALAVLGYLVTQAGFAAMPAKLPPALAGRLLAALTGLNLLLTVVSFATRPDGTSWQYGAYAGLAAALAAAAAPARLVVLGRASS